VTKWLNNTYAQPKWADQPRDPATRRLLDLAYTLVLWLTCIDAPENTKITRASESPQLSQGYA